MGSDSPQVGDLLARVRRRWRVLVTLRAAAMAGGGLTAVLVAAFGLPWAARAPDTVLVALAGAVLFAALALAGWVILRAAHAPSDRQVARLIEERWPELEDRLATTVDVAGRATGASPGPMAQLLGRDTLARLRAINVDEAVERRAMRRAAGASLLALLAVIGASFAVRGPILAAVDAVSSKITPSRLTLQVEPGDATVVSGQPVRVTARVRGARGPRAVDVVADDGGTTVARPMFTDGTGLASFTFDRVVKSFRYHVRAGSVSTRDYRVTVFTPPRVARIDVRYVYPARLGMEPRVERDSGDIFAPAGTRVEIRVQADQAVSGGVLRFAGGNELVLRPAEPTVLEGATTVTEDTSYRPVLRSTAGLVADGHTEYFIRVLGDRPPDVRIVRPAADRTVTPVEEVGVDVQAGDDNGVQRLELVYAIKGGPEKAIPFSFRAGGRAVSARQVMYLEDLHVQPGDFVTYYARARDAGVARRAAESRSDIYFLEVRPFDEQFAPAESQASAGAESGSLDDLASAQKDIIVATWKLDRRSTGAGASSSEDVRAIARAQGDLKARAASAGKGASLGAAVEAMGKAKDALDRLSTADALPPEMEAYNALLRAKADVQRWQVSRSGASGGGGGRGGQNQDLSSIFDHDLRREQQTVYETPNRPTRADDGADRAFDRVRELARRQSDLSQQQRDLAGQQGQLPPDELKRRLERLTREQSEIRRDAEELARQMSPGKAAAGRGGAASERGQQQGSPGSAAGSLEAASREMQGSASSLRRGDLSAASGHGSQAIGKLRDLERQMSGPQGRGAQDKTAAGTPDAAKTDPRLAESRDARRRLLEAERRVRALEARQVGETGPGWPDTGTAGGDERAAASGARGNQTGGRGADGRAGADQAVGTSGSDTRDARGLKDALDRARGDYMSELAKAAELASRLKQEQAGVGFTPEGQEMVLSAPGFHQDYSQWVALGRNVTLTLEQAEAAITSGLEQRAGKTSARAGGADRVPDEYRSLVEKYFRSLAKR